MERPENKIKKVLTIIIYLYFMAGIFWHLLPITKEIVIGITPYGLFLFPVLILYLERDTINLRTLIWLIIVYILTIMAEIIGVKTGLIFGSYFYKDILGIKIWGVPLLIGINWMMIIYGLFSFTGNYIKMNWFAQSLLIGFFAVLFDFVLEPVAIKLNYWEWNSVSIPLSNYISWFVISFLFAFAGFYMNIKKSSTLVIHYLFAQFLFFVTLDFFLKSI